MCTAWALSVEGYSSRSNATYAETRVPNFVSARFQSNHHRGYFWRNTSIKTVAGNRIPPDATRYFPEVARTVDPLTSVRTMAMGMTVNGRKKVVRRFRSRSG